MNGLLFIILWTLPLARVKGSLVSRGMTERSVIINFKLSIVNAKTSFKTWFLKGNQVFYVPCLC